MVSRRSRARRGRTRGLQCSTLARQTVLACVWGLAVAIGAAAADPVDEGARRTVEHALDRLAARDRPGRRDPELAAVAELGARATGPLARALDDRTGDPRRRAWAAFLLRPLAEDRATAALIHASTDPDWRVRLNAVNALGATGPRSAFSALLDRLDDDVAAVRLSACSAAGRLLGPDVVAHLEERYARSRSSAERELLVALARTLEHPACAPLLEVALADPAPRVRLLALHAASALALPLLDVHRAALAQDADAEVRLAAARAWRLRGAPIEPARLASWLADPDPALRAEAARALESRPHDPAPAGLTRALEREGDPAARVALARALARRAPRAALAALAPLARAPQGSPLTRARAAQALWLLPDTLAAPVRARLARHPSGLLAALARAPWAPRSHGAPLRELETPRFLLIADLPADEHVELALLLEALATSFETGHAAEPPVLAFTPEAFLLAGTPRAGTNDAPATDAPRTFRWPAGTTDPADVVRFAPNGVREVTFEDGTRVEAWPDGRRLARFPWGGVASTRVDRTSPPPTTIRVFPTRRDFRGFARAAEPRWPFLQDAGGYYSAARREIATFDKPYPPSTLATLCHEIQHLVLARDLPDAPVWLNEGLSEYVERAVERKGAIHVGAPHPGHVALLDALLAGGGLLPIDALVALDYDRFHGDGFGPDELANYAQSWALVHFLLESEGGALETVLHRYLRHLRLGAEPTPAWNHSVTRSGLAPAELERRFGAHIRSLVAAAR